MGESILRKGKSVQEKQGYGSVTGNETVLEYRVWGREWAQYKRLEKLCPGKSSQETDGTLKGAIEGPFYKV